MTCRTWRPGRFGCRRPGRSSARPRAPSRPAVACAAGASLVCHRQLEPQLQLLLDQPPVVAARIQLRDQAHRALPVALDHLAVLPLADLAHLVVELDLLDRLQHQLLLAFQLAHEAAALGGVRVGQLDAGQRIDHPPQRRRRERQRHPAQRQHDQRRREAHALDDEPVDQDDGGTRCAPDPRRHPAPPRRCCLDRVRTRRLCPAYQSRLRSSSSSLSASSGSEMEGSAVVVVGVCGRLASRHAP